MAAQGSANLRYVPKPPPIMAPTRSKLLVPPPAAADASAAGGGTGNKAAAAAAAGKLTKAEERAVGQVDRAIYRTYFRWRRAQGSCWLVGWLRSEERLLWLSIEQGAALLRARLVPRCHAYRPTPTPPSHTRAGPGAPHFGSPSPCSCWR